MRWSLRNGRVQRSNSVSGSNERLLVVHGVELGSHRGVVLGQFLHREVLCFVVGQSVVVARLEQLVLGLLQFGDGFVDSLDGLRELAAGQQAMSKLLTFQTDASPWLLQIAHADALFKNGAITERMADIVYERVLRDPSPIDWIYSPRDTLKYLSSDHEQVMERWFELAMNRKEVERAVEITAFNGAFGQRQRRRTFLINSAKANRRSYLCPDIIDESSPFDRRSARNQIALQTAELGA